MRESTIENGATRRICVWGWQSFKFSSPSQRHVPDRLFLRRGVCKFVEFKPTGGRATKAQEFCHEQLRDEGFEVHVIDTADPELLYRIFK